MAGKNLAKQTGGVAPYKSEGLPAITAEEVRARVNLIQQVMKGVMKKGTHYGTIPGAGDKPMLLKPGAEMLGVLFQLSHEYVVEDLTTDDAIRYRVRDRICSQATSTFVCEGVGEASSDEEKYRWRAAVCQEEFDATPEDRRRLKWKKGAYENGRWNKDVLSQIPQVRTQPADIANTVLKMAKKRAQVDATLTATGASDVFGQDLEDLPDELRTALVDEPIDVEPVDETPITAEMLQVILGLAATKDNGQGKVVTQRAILTNLKRQFSYEGELEAMTQPMAEATLKGLEQLADLAPAEKKTAANPRLAKLCILWAEVIDKDFDSDEGLRRWVESTYGTTHRSELTEEQQGDVIEVLEKMVNPERSEE